MKRTYQRHPQLEGRLPIPGVKVFTSGPLRIIISDREPTRHFPRGAWHISISCQNRNPTWEEIRDARYDLLPLDVTMAMILPPTDEYVNLHEYCFHLHQIQGEKDSLIVTL